MIFYFHQFLLFNDTHKLQVPCNNLESRRKQISLIEHEFRLLQKIQHVNLVSYLAMKYEKVDDLLHVYVADEFVSGNSLNVYVQVKQTTIYLRGLKFIKCFVPEESWSKCGRFTSYYDGCVAGLERPSQFQRRAQKPSPQLHLPR